MTTIKLVLVLLELSEAGCVETAPFLSYVMSIISRLGATGLSHKCSVLLRSRYEQYVRKTVVLTVRVSIHLEKDKHILLFGLFGKHIFNRQQVVLWVEQLSTNQKVSGLRHQYPVVCADICCLAAVQTTIPSRGSIKY